MLDCNQNKIKEIVEKSIELPPIKEGKFKLIFVNVYSASSYQILGSLYITSTHFLQIQEAGIDKIMAGNFVIEYKEGYIERIFKMMN